MTTPTKYVLQLKAKLVTSPIVASFNLVEEKVWPDRGYIRIRMSLSNGDFLEAAEYFLLEDDEYITRRYRYQWMDGERRELHKRWDNVEHYPDLPSFPHHVHVGKEENVEPGRRLSISQLLDVLASEIATGC
ncbi:MAG: hypothetical protein H8E47_12925 [Anaerolineales bacterium]|nr:hypothetical protein [Anaerolineales bacterium]